MRIEVRPHDPNSVMCKRLLVGSREELVESGNWKVVVVWTVKMWRYREIAVKRNECKC